MPDPKLKNEARWRHGMRIAVGGIITVRQRPETSKGIVFMTMEDETGMANLIVQPSVYQRCRRAARYRVIVLARGRVERQDQVVHMLMQRLQDVPQHEHVLHARSRDFH